MGITPRLHERGESLVRARGHFPTPKTRPGLFRRARTQSELWKRYKYRARKLAAYESIRESIFVHGLIRGETAIEATLAQFEKMEAEYEERGPGGFEAEFRQWYQEMDDEYYASGEFLHPELDIFYHGSTKG
jgi:hypothetical protein